MIEGDLHSRKSRYDRCHDATDKQYIQQAFKLSFPHSQMLFRCNNLLFIDCLHQSEMPPTCHTSPFSLSNSRHTRWRRWSIWPSYLSIAIPTSRSLSRSIYLYPCVEVEDSLPLGRTFLPRHYRNPDTEVPSPEYVTFLIRSLPSAEISLTFLSILSITELCVYRYRCSRVQCSRPPNLGNLARQVIIEIQPWTDEVRSWVTTISW